MSSFVDYRLGVKRKLLIVDDEEINRMLLTNILEKEYDILTANNGQEALEIVRKEKGRISLILLDLLMPVMDGYAFLEKVESDAVLKGIPVIVLTSERGAEVQSLTMGAADFIPKPYDAPEAILARIGRIIRLYEDTNIIGATQNDELTGLFNREYFIEYAMLFDQYYPDEAKEVIAINVNRFHVLNAMQGREFGDQVLSVIGKSIKEYVNESRGVACRYSADQFYVYVKSEGHEEKLMLSICDALKPLLDDADTRIRMGVFVGAVEGEDLAKSLDHALLACNGINDKYNRKIAYYNDKLQEKEHFDEMLIHDLDKALAEKQFKVFYQPKYAIQGDEPVLSSAEALVRWEHPELGMISPGKFIPLFEHNGMIGKVDRFVWKESARQIAEWKEKFGVTIPLSVNVSRVDVLNEGLASEMLEIVRAEGIDPKEYYLELTESAYVDNQSNIVTVAEKLREAGFCIEMDDFGTGYSSLNMLTSLPFDVLKLDMIFVRNVHKDSKAYRLVEFILDVARFLGVTVIAEGVEYREQYELLKKLGCDVIQGYYFSKPVCAAEFERFITG